jgi:hypothetical protein
MARTSWLLPLVLLALPALAASAAPGLAPVAAMQGRKAETLADVQALGPVPQPTDSTAARWQRTQQYAALVRFGLWDELIALRPPPAGDTVASAGYLYGRGVALAARGDSAGAQQALAQLYALAATRDDAELAALLRVAVPIVAARIAATAGDADAAVGQLQQAVSAEDQLSPAAAASWFFPARHLLGAQLLIAHRAREAEQVYRADLARHPDNGWALFGLAQALRAQGRAAAAAHTERAFRSAWQGADVRLTASAFWFAGADTTSCECQRQGLSRAAGGS